MFDSKKVRLFASVTTLALVLAACGGGDKPANNTTTTNNTTNETTTNETTTNETTTNENTDANAGDLDALGDIAVVSREDGSGTRGAFTEITGLMEKDENGNEVDNTTLEADIQNSTNGVMTTVAGNESAIGYISLGSLNDTVKALKVDGVEATEENVASGEYPISRPFLLVTKEAPAAGSVEEDFIKFAHSTQGEEIVKEEGFVPVKAEGDYTASDLSGSITIAGSTSVTPLVEKLAEKYQELNPNAKIEIQSTGSSAGIQSTIDGSAQIGMSSRELKDDEAGQVQEVVLAQDGIAVVVNTNNPLEEISLENVKKVFAGELMTWTELAK